jgi:phenylalanyl-tRNA synthetase beta chain
MKISLNWLKTHIELNETPEQISDLLTNCGLEVEDLYTSGSVKNGFEGLIVGHVLEVKQHPNADRLRLTIVDVGNGTPLNIVCGAPNVEVDQKVIVAPIGTTIYPLNGEPITMKKAKIRGEESEGMICAEDEIGLGSNHDGILVLDSDCITGKPVSEYLQPDTDTILEIGLTPNRGDAASHLGIARDLRALLNRPLKAIEEKSSPFGNQTPTINVAVNDSASCGRYSGVLIKDVTVAASPEWLQKHLKAIGINPINNVVDITNFIMHDIGQPMHAFDADKISGDIEVRFALSGQSLITLDKLERKLQGPELIIADASGPIALAGVMGGQSTAISDNTTNIFLESAWFDAACVRKTAKLHSISTDSSFRFERGINPDMTIKAIEKATALVLEVCGGKTEFSTIDIQSLPTPKTKIHLLYAKINSIVGTEIEPARVMQIVTNLDMEILSEGRMGLDLILPAYRMDVTRDIDVIEDILRIYGFDNVPFPTVMHSAAVVEPKPDKHSIKQMICNYLSAQGFNEIMTNSLTSEHYFNEQELLKTVKLLNPLSIELSVMRSDMQASVLEVVAYNKNRKANDLKFYEFGKVYQKSETGYKEFEKLVLTVTGNKKPANWRTKAEKAEYYYLKSIVENIMQVVGIKKAKMPEIFEVKAEMMKKMDIKGTVWYTEINVDYLLSAIRNQTFKLQDIPVFPEVNRDLSLVLDKSVTYKQIEQIVSSTAGKYLQKITLFDVFEGKPLPDGQKSYTFNMVLYDNEKTMNDKQIDAIMQKLITTFENQLKAVIRK